MTKHYDVKDEYGRKIGEAHERPGVDYEKVGRVAGEGAVVAGGLGVGLIVWLLRRVPALIGAVIILIALFVQKGAKDPDMGAIVAGYGIGGLLIIVQFAMTGIFTENVRRRPLLPIFVAIALGAVAMGAYAYFDTQSRARSDARRATSVVLDRTRFANQRAPQDTATPDV